MTKIDVNEIKRKIIEILKEDGPNLPLPLARKLHIEPLFTSAILSELMNEKKIKTSFMKVGSSPLYYLPEDKNKLEKFSDNLTGVEKEAFLKLKDNKILDDEKQEPRLRVALRSIKDFAIPIQIKDKLHWKYLTSSEEKIRNSLDEEDNVAIGERVVGQKIWEDIKKVHEKKEEMKKIENIFEEKKKEVLEIEEKEQIKDFDKPLTEKKRIKKITAKDLFLEQAKQILNQKRIEIIELIQYDTKQLLAKARVQIDKTCILLFMDKKRPEERDLMKAYKKSLEYNLPFYVITNSLPNKKILESKEMYSKLLGFDSIE